MTYASRILVIEDDKQIASALVHTLSTAYDIDCVFTGKEGLYKTDTNEYALILLDLNLPDMNGLQVCQQLRERGFTAPICVISGESAVRSKIDLLDSGADDYLTKPFTVGELNARIRVHLRKKQLVQWTKPLIEVKGVKLDRNNLSLERDGKIILLRKKEFQILECLMTSPGNIVTRQALLTRVWKDPEAIWTNTLDVHMKYLRDKIDRPFENKLLRTVHGVGYKFAPPLEIKTSQEAPQIAA
ncbi:MAG TPA: response regulator transcription factor [Candidatus Saccharimonadales bacterium]|nr:response regulator transcription factor [Candidatus Saccharimonadales bacterium]